MTYLPQYYFGDIPAEEMKEIVGNAGIKVPDPARHSEDSGEVER